MADLPWELHIGYYMPHVSYGDSTVAKYATLRDCVCAMNTTAKLWDAAGYPMSFAWADGPGNVRIPLHGVVPKNDTVIAVDTIIFNPEW